MVIFYAKAREKFLTKQLDWLTDTIKMLAVDAGYTPLESHQFVSEIPAAAIMRRSTALSSKLGTNGFAKSDAPIFASWSDTEEVRGFVFYRDTGNDATSELLTFTDDGPGLPFVPNGADYAFPFNATDGGYFRA